MNALFQYVVVLSAITGLLIGSFLNVVAIRLLENKSIAYPPSHCVHCKHRLGVLDLIPVFSYLFLRGKCRYCKQKISSYYPIFELLTAGLFVLMTLIIGIQFELLAGLLLVGVLIVIVQTDLRSMLILDKVVWSGTAIAILLRLWVHPLPLWNYVVAAVLCSGLLFVVAMITNGGFGGGDIKLYVFIGLILGIKLTLLSFFLASAAGFLYGIYLILFKKVQKKQAIPFGPFIAIGAMVSYLFGDLLIQTYIQLLQPL